MEIQLVIIIIIPF